jgi:hypothetical protein
MEEDAGVDEKELKEVGRPGTDLASEASLVNLLVRSSALDLASCPMLAINLPRRPKGDTCSQQRGILLRLNPDITRPPIEALTTREPGITEFSC